MWIVQMVVKTNIHNNTMTKDITLWMCDALINDLALQHGGEGFKSLNLQTTLWMPKYSKLVELWYVG
jgi:hypothetical protein